MRDYEAMLPWASERQKQYVRECQRHGSARKAAAALGVNARTVDRALAQLTRKAAAAGHSPEADGMGRAPEGFHVRGKSTLYDADGKITQQWVKTNRDGDDRLAQMREAVEELAEDYRGIIKPTKAPQNVADDLLTVVPMGDAHVGLYCWREETGEDFDLKIARELMLGAVGRLARSVPKCGEALLINLGDFYHSDTSQNQTLRSHNALDVDTRWAHVLRVGVAAMKSAITELLKRADRVRVINCIGNHDDHSSQFLSLVLAEAYANEPRVEVDQSPTAFHYHRFGDVLIGATHGHTVKADQLPGIMAHDRAEDWGKTRYRQWYVGHWHSRRSWDYPGCNVEYCRSLVAKDAWTTAAGYRSHRDMRAIVYHRQWGEVEQHRVGVERVEADQQE